MNKVESIVITAFLQGRPAKSGNTKTDGKTLTLHGNVIAWWSDKYEITATYAGWKTRTTTSRLNAISQGIGYGSLFSSSTKDNVSPTSIHKMEVPKVGLPMFARV